MLPSALLHTLKQDATGTLVTRVAFRDLQIQGKGCIGLQYPVTSFRKTPEVIDNDPNHPKGMVNSLPATVAHANLPGGMNSANMSTGPSVSPGGGLQVEIQGAINEIMELKVIDLKDICRSLSLQTTGRKNQLQERINEYIKGSMSIGHIDPWRPKAIRVLIQKIHNKELPLPPYSDVWNTIRAGKLGPGVSNVLQRGTRQQQQMQQPKSLNDSVPFLVSNFYNLIELLRDSTQIIKKTNGRGVNTVKFSLTQNMLRLLLRSNKYRIYFISYENKQYDGKKKLFIDFPYPNEIVFNGRKVADNVRGLKNRPGTAKPADLTPYLKLSTSQLNTLEIVYAFTKIEYRISCYLVEVITPEELLQIVLHRPKISRQHTLNYIKKTISEEDDDLVTTSTVMSLQCPISCTRMKYPAKSRLCKHLQCFDALWYLHSQLQVPVWECPVCQGSTPISNLAISEYVDDILKKCPEDVEQVELSTDGSWVPIQEEAETTSHDHSGKAVPPTGQAIKSEDTGEMSPSAHHHAHNPEHEVISLDSSSENNDEVEDEEQISGPGLSTRQVPTIESEEDGGADSDTPLLELSRKGGTQPVSEPQPQLERTIMSSQPTFTTAPQTQNLSRQLSQPPQTTEPNLPLLQNTQPSSQVSAGTSGLAPRLPDTTSLRNNQSSLLNLSNAPLPPVSQIIPTVNATSTPSYVVPTLTSPRGTVFHQSMNLLGILGPPPKLNQGLLEMQNETGNSPSSNHPPTSSPSFAPPLVSSGPLPSTNGPSTLPGMDRPHHRQGRTATTDVSPFIPRKPYANILPRKRRNSALVSDQNLNELGIEMRNPNANKSHENDENGRGAIDTEFIDLTDD